MKAFEYVNPPNVRAAAAELAKAGPGAKIMAGGIDLLGEMKDYIRTPDVVVNLKSIAGLKKWQMDSRVLRLGPLVTLAEIAENPQIRKRFTALAEAAESVGTPQIRNVGTIGGNLCQRPRCWYYRDEEVKCLKKGGDHCYAVDGENQYHAILGGGPSYIVHPSDCAPALIALGGSAEITGPHGIRQVPLERFFVLPNQDFLNENVLRPDEVVTRVIVPVPPANARSHYLKVRHKESFDWALVGAAAMLVMDGRMVKNARIVMSGVAPIPWRSREAEAVLKGRPLTATLAAHAGAAAVARARPLSKNAYKVPLAQNAVKLAVLEAARLST